jgi:hypothetical protein
MSWRERGLMLLALCAAAAAGAAFGFVRLAAGGIS